MDYFYFTLSENKEITLYLIFNSCTNTNITRLPPCILKTNQNHAECRMLYSVLASRRTVAAGRTVFDASKRCFIHLNTFF